MGNILYWCLMITFVAAWFTHVFECIDHNMWGFLLAGAIVFPIAVVHGITLWF